MQGFIILVANLAVSSEVDYTRDLTVGHWKCVDGHKQAICPNFYFQRVVVVNLVCNRGESDLHWLRETRRKLALADGTDCEVWGRWFDQSYSLRLVGCVEDLHCDRMLHAWLVASELDL